MVTSLLAMAVLTLWAVLAVIRSTRSGRSKALWLLALFFTGGIGGAIYLLQEDRAQVRAGGAERQDRTSDYLT